MSAVRWSCRTAVLVLAALAAPAACSDDNAFPTTPGTPEADAVKAMTRAIQGEYHAEDTYLRVLADFGRVSPFQDVMYAAQRHSQAIAYLFVKREVEIPASDWDINNVATFDSLQEACAAGAQAEADNIALYDELLKLNLPADVEQVFSANRAASFNDRLPAFEACG
jgi:hypothetical protein